MMMMILMFLIDDSIICITEPNTRVLYDHHDEEFMNEVVLDKI